MPRKALDTQTLDLFADYQPPETVKSFEPARVRAVSLKDEIALGVKATLDDSEMPRDAIAAAMAEWLEESASKATLDKYASQSANDAIIPTVKLVALCHVTGDHRVLQLLADKLGLMVVDKKFEPLIQLGLAAERKDHVDQVAKKVSAEFDLSVKLVRNLFGGGKP
jgi:hypothetical protein